MKTLIRVLVCVAIGSGCVVQEAWNQPGDTPCEIVDPCLSGTTSCNARVAGISLIRTPRFWLLDLDSSLNSAPNGSSVGKLPAFDEAAVIAAAKRCEAGEGCGAEMTRWEIDELIDRTAQAKVAQLPIASVPTVAYQRASKPSSGDPVRAVVQIWGNARALSVAVPQISSQLGNGCRQCVPCIPAQCEGPPPIPGRTYFVDFRRPILGRGSW